MSAAVNTVNVSRRRSSRRSPIAASSRRISAETRVSSTTSRRCFASAIPPPPQRGHTDTGGIPPAPPAGVASVVYPQSGQHAQVRIASPSRPRSMESTSISRPRA